MSYADYIHGYYSRLSHEYSDLLPQGYGMWSLSGESSPESMYASAMQLWYTTMGNYAGMYGGDYKSTETTSAPDKNLRLQPYVTEDGSTYFINADTGQPYASFVKQENGLLGFYGTDSAANYLGGKGYLSTVYSMVADGNYFRDVKENTTYSGGW